MKRIDAHQHFWRYLPAFYRWIAPGSTLARDRLPEDVRPLLDLSGIDGCIAVQAQQNEIETAFALAAERPWILGVIGWTDLTTPDLTNQLARWHGTALIGMRHMVQDEPDPNWLLRTDVKAGVRTLLDQGLAYDILVRTPQMPQVPAFLDAVGGGALVLDHAGKPDIAGGIWQPWAETIRAIARHPTVICKLSGFVTEADHVRWSADDVVRYLNHLLACFGPDRLMFGSDWPVCTLAADYPRVLALIEDFVQQACPAHRDAVLGGTARRAYSLSELIAWS